MILYQISVIDRQLPTLYAGYVDEETFKKMWSPRPFIFDASSIEAAENLVGKVDGLYITPKYTLKYRDSLG